MLPGLRSAVLASALGGAILLVLCGTAIAVGATLVAGPREAPPAIRLGTAGRTVAVVSPRAGWHVDVPVEVRRPGRLTLSVVAGPETIAQGEVAVEGGGVTWVSIALTRSDAIAWAGVPVAVVGRHEGAYGRATRASVTGVLGRTAS